MQLTFRTLSPLGLLLALHTWSPSMTAQPATARGVSPADEATLRALDAQWAETYATHDTTRFLQLVADDFVMTSGNGQRKDRAAELADVRATAGFAVDFFRTENVSMRLRDGTALVYGDLFWSVTSNGQAATQRRRYTATWVRVTLSTWRMIGLHVGPAPNTGGR